MLGMQVAHIVVINQNSFSYCDSPELKSIESSTVLNTDNAVPDLITVQKHPIIKESHIFQGC
jgi:hypothetical protein